MNTPANPDNWNRIQVDQSRTGKDPEVVPGILAVTQRLVLHKDEYLCAGCFRYIEGDDSGFFIRHAEGCSQIADIASVNRR